MAPHTVAVVVDEGMHAFEFGVACEVFGLRRPELGVAWYEFRVCGPSVAAVRANEGFALQADHDWSALVEADTVGVPAAPALPEPSNPALVDALRTAARNGARMVSFCSGAFLLAEAGLLDDRPATTHWMHAPAFRRRFPRVKLHPDVLYVDDGDVLTSAGTAAGIDLALHIVRLDHGAEVANAVARRMVVPPHRDGGQAQFTSPPLPSPGDADVGLAATMDWMVANLGEPLTVADMAAHALMSARTFARRFRAATGTTPHEWLSAHRVRHAQRLLEATDLPVERVAVEAGLGSAANLRLRFRTVGLSPTVYRRRFRLSSV
ncbi:MAG: helix-turn-helix domain-containing protein [Acidimicrobiales bacterium]|nr:helix-turn-helix domain-containing protein [Acidimicrobiales bacterium]